MTVNNNTLRPAHKTLKQLTLENWAESLRIECNARSGYVHSVDLLVEARVCEETSMKE